MSSSPPLPPVLLAEDDEHDAFFMRRAFTLAQVSHPLIVVPNGQEAVYYLLGHGPYAERARYPEPCLLLLDLKMPLMDGFDVLTWIGEQPRWRDRLTVIVLSASNCQSDVEKCMALGTKEYLLKPSVFTDLVQMVRDLKWHWLGAPPPP